MKRRILTVVLMLTFVITAALGVATVAYADDPEEAKITSVEIGHGGHWDNALVVYFDHTVSTDGPDGTWGNGDIISRARDYITLVDAQGTDLLKDVYLYKGSQEMVINIANQISYAVGAKLTVKEGFALETGAVVKTAVTYEYKTEGSPWVPEGEEASEIELRFRKEGDLDSVRAGNDGAWGDASTYFQIGFDQTEWKGDLGQYADIYSDNQGKVEITDYDGTTVTVDNITYINSGNFLVRMANGLGKTLLPGAKITLKQGFKVVAGITTAVLPEDRTFVVDKADKAVWIIPAYTPSMDATSITFTNDKHDLHVGETLQLEWQLSDGAIGTPKFTVQNGNVTVDGKGLVTAETEGADVITATIGEVNATYEINVQPQLVLEGVELVGAYKYWVAQNEKAELPELKARPVYEGGTYGAEFDLVAGENLTVPEIDTATLGERTVQLTITYDGQQYPVDYQVQVYEIWDMDISEVAIVDWFNGAVFIQYPNSTTNLANITNQTFPDVNAKITYERKDGTVLYGKGADKTVGCYVLSNGNVACFFFQFGPEDIEDGVVKLDAINAPGKYEVGDIITLEAGFAGYRWTGDIQATATDNNAMAEGTGMFIKECELKETVQYRYDGSMWTFFLEYEDLSVAKETIDLEVNGSPVSIGAKRVPDNATSGTITYVSSEPETVSVSPLGVVSGLKEGSAVITVTLDGGKAGKIEKQVTVTVTDAIQRIVFEETELSFGVGDEFDPTTLHAVFEYGSGKKGGAVDLSSARVSGLDTSAAGEGTIVISVTVDGKTYSGSIRYTVIEKVGCGGCKNALGIEALAAFALLGVAGFMKRKVK